MISEKILGKPFSYYDEKHKKYAVLAPFKAPLRNSCEGCVFYNNHTILCNEESIYKQLGPCDSIERKDHNNVFFKVCTIRPADQLKAAISWEAYRWVQDHPGRGKFWMGVYIVAKKLFPKELAKIAQSDFAPSKNKENLAPFWKEFSRLIDKKMAHLTVRDLKDLIQEYPDDTEINFLDEEGMVVQLDDIELMQGKTTSVVITLK